MRVAPVICHLPHRLRCSDRGTCAKVLSARQVSDYEARSLVDECFRRLVRDYVMVQDCRVRQRFDRCHADKCRKPQVGSPNLSPMALEVSLEERIVFPVEGLHLLELSYARNLFRKHTMQLGVDTMRLDRRGDERAHALLYRLVCNLRQFGPDYLPDLLLMALDDRSHERLLAGEVLVERAHAHARHFGVSVRAGFVEPFPDENASSCID